MKILVCAAHPDDEVLGCGGAIASYSNNGDEVVSVIFTYGENANLAESPKKLAKKRVRESIRAGKILGVKKMYFLGLPDNTLRGEVRLEETKKKISDILKRHNPDIILTHSKDDYHPAHRNVAHLVKRKINKLGLKSRIYTFSTGTPIRAVHKASPKLVIDTSKFRKKKRRALRQFHSQRWNFYYFGWLSIIKDFWNGIRHNKRSVEVFYKW
jgi:LmbE family N-acetylglucosaminyl deacetylase|tara:strand:- start:48 stop:683 length:636 start_codon:yes stop_codon:yes gene_type:complete